MPVEIPVTATVRGVPRGAGLADIRFRPRRIERVLSGGNDVPALFGYERCATRGHTREELTMSASADAKAHLGPALTRLGFSLEAADEDVVHGERPAWAVYYRGTDCKLQVCWSARDSGIDFMLAPLDAPYEFGPSSRSKGWEYMLTLSETDDGLQTPSLEASDETQWRWREALLLTHVERLVLHC
jgi:hypothetical protein